MPRLTPYAAQEIAMVSSTPAGRGLPIGLMPGALPSDHASRQTLSTTAMRFFFGHNHFGVFMTRCPSADPAVRQLQRKLPHTGVSWIGSHCGRDGCHVGDTHLAG